MLKVRRGVLDLRDREEIEVAARVENDDVHAVR